MTDYENMPIEELRKLKEEADKNALIDSLKAEEAEKAKKAKETEEAELKVKWLEEYKTEHPGIDDFIAGKPDDKLETGGDKPGSGKPDDWGKLFINRNLKKYGVQYADYSNSEWIEPGYFENDSDTGCEDNVSAWSPDDVYANVIWNTAICTADLMKICVKGLDIKQGEGLSVKIRAFGAFSDPVEKGSCECGTCDTISFSNFTLTLKQWNLESVICKRDMWDAGSIVMDAHLKAMSDSWKQWFDKKIYAELETVAVPGYTETLPAVLACTPALKAGCCEDTSMYNLYNAVNNVISDMREGTSPRNPDYLIVSPSVAKMFKGLQNPTPIWYSDVKFDADGRLTRLAGLKVIEYCGANPCAATVDEVMAIIIDSKRAVGCVFGEKPTMYKFFQSDCNSYRIDFWSFVGFGELDTSYIAHIVNPAA